MQPVSCQQFDQALRSLSLVLLLQFFNVNGKTEDDLNWRRWPTCLVVDICVSLKLKAVSDDLLPPLTERPNEMGMWRVRVVQIAPK